MINPELVQLVRERQSSWKEDQLILIHERTIEAKREIRRLIESFRAEDPSLGRIALFGSLASGVSDRLDFDIDLSFEGSEYYRCVALTLDSIYKVDLVDYRAAAPFIRNEIDSKGIVVYEPKS